MDSTNPVATQVDNSTELAFTESVTGVKKNPKNVQIIERAYDVLDQMEPIAEQIFISEVVIRYKHGDKTTSLSFHDYSNF